MKRWTTIVMVCVCALTPAAARADNGGWLDWLYRLDPKFWGAGTDFHVLCLNKSNEPMRCEELFFIPRLFKRGQPPPPRIDYANLQHEFDLRVAYYHNYGQLLPDDEQDNSAKAWKLMFLYRYHPDLHVTVGSGLGFMTFFPKPEKSSADSFSSAVLTPISVTYAPFTSGGIVRKAFYVRGESTYFTRSFSGADFGSASAYRTRGEWNFSAAIGFDFRRRSLGLPRP